MSIRILAFDTSTEVCSVALMIDDVITSCCGIYLNQHEKQILSMIDKLLSEAGITLESLDFLVVCRGPGSFVGVRVGIGIAQGLSLGMNIPLVEVSSLAMLAQGIWRLIKVRKVLATINARLGELYLACYYRTDDGIWLLKWRKELLITPTDMSVLISKLYGEWVLVGTGWERYPILFSNNIQIITIKKFLYPSAQDMLPIAIKNWETGNVFAVDQIQPVYLSEITWNRLLRS